MNKSNLNWKIKESKKVIKAALKKWGEESAVAFTGGKDSTVLLDLIRRVRTEIPPVMFIDHKLHFEETYKFVEQLKDIWKLKVFYETDERTLRKMNRTKDSRKKRELSRMLKIKSTENAIKKHRWKALFVGIRWDEHPARSKETYFTKKDNHFRVHPILHFTEENVWEYIKKFKVPYNPLYDRGYRSIGEKPFTKPVEDKSAPERAGREKDKEKIMERLRALGYF